MTGWLNAMKRIAGVAAGVGLIWSSLAGEAQALLAITYNYDFSLSISPGDFATFDISTSQPVAAGGTGILGVSGYANLPDYGIVGSISGPAGLPAENVIYPGATPFHSISFTADGYFIELIDPPMTYTFDICSTQAACTPGAGFNPLYTGTGQVSAVPEPSSWAMLIIGFAAVGFVAQRQRAKLRLA